MEIIVDDPLPDDPTGSAKIGESYQSLDNMKAMSLPLASHYITGQLYRSARPLLIRVCTDR